MLCARLVKLHLWSQEKVVNFENLTNLTRWPQPAPIFLLVKICKNPVFGVAKLQEPNLVPTHRDRRHRAKIEPLTHRDRRHRAKIGPKVEKLVCGIE